MTALLLFAILVVLLIVTGLMPGVLRALGSALAIAVVIAIFQMIGLAYGLGAIALIAVALGGLSIWDSPDMQRRRYLKRCGLNPNDKP